MKQLSSIMKEVNFNSMKPLLTALLIAGTVIGCSLNQVSRPFVIISKGYTNSGIWNYRYQDSHGREYAFQDTVKYNIGDTLK